MSIKPRRPQPTGRPQSRYAPGRTSGTHQQVRRAAPPVASQSKSIPLQRRPLTTDILRRLETDPAFMVMTGDNHWIDPYTGQSVPAAQGRLEAARAHLMDSGSWRDRDPLPRMQLEIVRWRIDLMRLLPSEPRLRIFGRDGRWLNPFNGELVADIVREDGKITATTITAMARVLCTCPPAASGRLLDSQSLASKVQALGLTRSDPNLGKSTDTGLSIDMEKARNVQQNMLSALPDLDGYDLAVHFTPQAGVSGDFYEVITMHSGDLMFFVGDVSGHGMQAALVVATALKTIRFLARTATSVTGLLTQFNDEIRADLLPGQFITMFAGQLDPVAGTLQCVRAGHHSGILMNLENDTVMRRVGRPGMAIGLAPSSVFANSIHVEIVQLQSGDLLVQYTDGVTEAMDTQGVEFGEAGFYSSIFRQCNGSLQELVDGIAKDVQAYVRGLLEDDLTIFAMAVIPPPEDVATSGEWDENENDNDTHG